MSEDTVKLMDYLNIKKAHILGHSMGGLKPQEIAINYPERVMKLILASTWAYQDDDANGITPPCWKKRNYLSDKREYCGDAIMNKPFNRWFVAPALKN